MGSEVLVIMLLLVGLQSDVVQRYAAIRGINSCHNMPQH